jgi:hypothetical protein
MKARRVDDAQVPLGVAYDRSESTDAKGRVGRHDEGRPGQLQLGDEANSCFETRSVARCTLRKHRLPRRTDIDVLGAGPAVP